MASDIGVRLELLVNLFETGLLQIGKGEIGGMSASRSVTVLVKQSHEWWVAWCRPASHLRAECHSYCVSQPIGTCSLIHGQASKTFGGHLCLHAMSFAPWSIAALALVPCLMSCDSQALWNGDRKWDLFAKLLRGKSTNTLFCLHDKTHACTPLSCKAFTVARTAKLDVLSVESIVPARSAAWREKPSC